MVGLLCGLGDWYYWLWDEFNQLIPLIAFGMEG